MKNKNNESLEDYEEGSFYVPVRRKCWQFWLPKFVSAGTYTKIGNKWQLSAFKRNWFSWD